MNITPGACIEDNSKEKTMWQENYSIKPKVCSAIEAGVTNSEKFSPSYTCKLGETTFTKTSCTSGDIGEKLQSFVTYTCVPADTYNTDI